MEIFSSFALLLFVVLYPPLRKTYFSRQPLQKDRAVTERLPFVDFARGVAIVAVIFIHSIFLFKEASPGHPPFYLDLLNNLSRFAVGIFFITSGALLKSGISLGKIKKTFLPYVLICLVVGLLQGKTWDLIVGGVIRGDLLPPYYFIPVLFQFYLLFPLLLRLSASKYFLPLSLVISYIFYITPNLAYINGVPTFGPFLFLVAFGLYHRKALVAKGNLPKIDHILVLVMVYVALCFVFPGHYYNSRFFYAPAVFLLMKHAWENFVPTRKLKLIQSYGQSSLWIYLLHFPIQMLLFWLLPYSGGYSVFLYVFMITILAVVGSGVAILATKKRQVLRHWRFFVNL